MLFCLKKEVAMTMFITHDIKWDRAIKCDNFNKNLVIDKDLKSRKGIILKVNHLVLWGDIESDRLVKIETKGDFFCFGRVLSEPARYSIGGDTYENWTDAGVLERIESLGIPIMQKIHQDAAFQPRLSLEWPPMASIVKDLSSRDQIEWNNPDKNLVILAELASGENITLKVNNLVVCGKGHIKAEHGNINIDVQGDFFNLGQMTAHEFTHQVGGTVYEAWSDDVIELIRNLGVSIKRKSTGELKFSAPLY
jgi:hypothetical protein